MMLALIQSLSVILCINHKKTHTNFHTIKDKSRELMTTIQEEAIVKRSFIEQGGNRVAIVTSNKLNTAHHYRFASLSEIDYLVVEDDRRKEILEN